MIEDREIIAERERIDDFGEWLRQVAPGWSISIPEVQRTEMGMSYITFSLRRGGLAVALCDSPEDALAKIRDDELLAQYLQRAYGLLVLGRKNLGRINNQAD